MTFSVVLGHSVASLGLTPSSLMCEGCDFFRIDSDVDSCGSDVSVVSVVSRLDVVKSALRSWVGRKRGE